MCLKSSYTSEPAIVTLKPPTLAGLPKKLCCASSAESLESEISITEAQSQTRPTLLKIKKAFTESGSDLQAVIRDTCVSAGTRASKPSDGILVPPPETRVDNVPSVDTQAFSFPSQQSRLANDQNITFGQIEIAALSPLHIDSVVFEPGEYCSPPTKADYGSFCAAPLNNHNSSVESEREAEQVNCSRLIDALDIQSPALFKLAASSGLQSTPYKLRVELDEELGTPPTIGTVVSAAHGKNEASKVLKEQPLSPGSLETEKRRVADHIHHFNKLTLHSPRGSMSAQIRSPLKFHRTPVRQTVRRINSLVGDSRRPGQNTRKTTSQSGQVSGLTLRPHQSVLQVEVCNSNCPKKKPPPVPPRKPSTLARKPQASALGDVTNKVQPKTRTDDSVPDPSGTQKPLVQQFVEKVMNHYRGSPRNPLNQARLLSATKPVDL